MLNVRVFFDLIGGTKEVMRITNLTRSRISQMRTWNRIQPSLEGVLKEKYPKAYKQASESNS